MTGNFGLDDALGMDERARLARAQRVIACRYGETGAVERLTAWLVANGYEDAVQSAPTTDTAQDGGDR